VGYRGAMSDGVHDDDWNAEIVAFPGVAPGAPSPSPTAPEPPLRDVIGEVLRDERLDQGRTLADVAGGAHVSLPYLSEVERGRKEVSSEVLAAICDALELPLVDVLERSADRLRTRAECTHRFLLLAA
jgi:DNA-binding Xre family transcriptional regulator